MAPIRWGRRRLRRSDEWSAKGAGILASGCSREARTASRLLRKVGDGRDSRASYAAGIRPRPRFIFVGARPQAVEASVNGRGKKMASGEMDTPDCAPRSLQRTAPSLPPGALSGVAGGHAWHRRGSLVHQLVGNGARGNRLSSDRRHAQEHLAPLASDRDASSSGKRRRGGNGWEPQRV